MRRTLSILALSMALFQGAQAATEPTVKDGDNPVTVVFPDQGNVTFATVTANGATTMTAITSPDLPDGFVLWDDSPGKSYYEVTTTAGYTSPATVCLYYDSSLSDEVPQLIHWYRNEWADITLYVTETGACGELMGLNHYFAVGTGFPFNMMLSSISTTNTEKREGADSWSGKGVINGFGNSEINPLDVGGFTIKLIDGNNVVQDLIDISGSQCRLIMRSRGLSCKIKGVGSLSLKPFTSTTWTMAKSNKVNDVKTKSHSSHHNSTKTHGPKGTTEDKVTYHKIAFKFYKRNFLDNDTPPGPLTVVIDDFPTLGTGVELASLLSVCKEKTTPSGTQKISCTPFDPEA